MKNRNSLESISGDLSFIREIHDEMDDHPVPEMSKQMISDWLDELEKDKDRVMAEKYAIDMRDALQAVIHWQESEGIKDRIPEDSLLYTQIHTAYYNATGGV